MMPVYNREQLPLVMNVKEVSETLRISRKAAYELTKQQDFPCIKIGERRFIIPRDRFFQWMENSAQQQ